MLAGGLNSTNKRIKRLHSELEEHWTTTTSTIKNINKEFQQKQQFYLVFLCSWCLRITRFLCGSSCLLRRHTWLFFGSTGFLWRHACSVRILCKKYKSEEYTCIPRIDSAETLYHHAKATTWSNLCTAMECWITPGCVGPSVQSAERVLANKERKYSQQACEESRHTISPCLFWLLVLSRHSFSLQEHLASPQPVNNQNNRDSGNCSRQDTQSRQ